MKTHYYDQTILEKAPDYVVRDYRAKGHDGAACGYVRKGTTTKKADVTCKICLRAMSV